MLCRRTEYSAGDQLVARGEENDYAFLIISGQLDALHIAGEKHHVIGKYGPGQFVYGCALLGRITSVFTLKARENSTVLCLRREEFQKTLQQFPTALTRVTGGLVSELVNWDRSQLEKQGRGTGRDYQAIGISLL